VSDAPPIVTAFVSEPGYLPDRGGASPRAGL